MVCSNLGPCPQLPCFPQLTIIGCNSTCSETCDFSSLGHYLVYLLCAYLGQSSRVNWGNSKVAWKELGKFLSVHCSSCGVLDTKFHRCLFLSIPYDKEVDRELQLDCSACLTMVVTGLLSCSTFSIFSCLHLYMLSVFRTCSVRKLNHFAVFEVLLLN